MYLPCTCHRIWDPNKRSATAQKRALNCGESVESMTGIEPACSAWECDLMALFQVGGLALRGCFEGIQGARCICVYLMVVKRECNLSPDSRRFLSGTETFLARRPSLDT